MARTRALVRGDARYRRHDITVEHYVVSTGLRQMVLGSGVAAAVDDVWGCELLPDPPAPGFLAGGGTAERSGRAQPGRLHHRQHLEDPRDL
jgi:hypothetical protein